MIYKISSVSKTRTFGGRRYHLLGHERLKSVANQRAEKLRKNGISARVTPQPGHGQGGWNIYTRVH